jgi:hypothetical protein
VRAPPSSPSCSCANRRASYLALVYDAARYEQGTAERIADRVAAAITASADTPAGALRSELFAGFHLEGE